MTPAEAAQRIGVPAHLVTDLREHPGGHVATVHGREWLVSDTVARPYVPDVDDVEPEPVRVTEPDTSAADAKPAPRTRKAAR